MTPVLAVLALAVWHTTLVHAYTMVPRWGAAVAVLSHPHTVVVQGGKTDPSAQYSYSSSPNSADTLLLPLTESFPAASPPYSLLSSESPGPSYAWHCLAPLSEHAGKWTLLSFGGDGGWSSPISDKRSAHLLTLNPSTGEMSYTHPEEGWGSQPSRRVRHSCAAPVTGGKVYITGGQVPDNREAFAHTFVFDPESLSFAELAPLPTALYGHSSVLLSNGTLLVFGGVAARSGASAVQPLDTVYTLDTTAESPTWVSVSVPTPPRARHGASATLNPDGSVFIFGGVDVDGKPLNDGWILDPQHLTWTQTFDGGSAVPGRYNQAGATGGGGQVIIVGGYGESAPAPPDTIIINSEAAPLGMHGSGSGTGTPASGESGDGLPSGTGESDFVPHAASGTGTGEGSTGTGQSGAGTGGGGTGDPNTAGGTGSSSPGSTSGSASGSTTGSNTGNGSNNGDGSNNAGTSTLPEYTPAPITSDSPITDLDGPPGGSDSAGGGEDGSTSGTETDAPTTTDGTSPIGAGPGVAPLTLGLTVGLIGGLLLIASALLLFWWCLRRRRGKKGEEERRNLIQDDMEKGGREKGAGLLNSAPNNDRPPPQRQKSLLQRLGTKIWRRPEYTPLGDRDREPTIIPATTRDHFQPQPPLPFQAPNSLPRPPKPYYPDDMVFGPGRDMGVRDEVPRCFNLPVSGAVAGAAATVGSVGLRPSYKRQTTAELSNISPFPYTIPSANLMAGAVVERPRESYGDVYESDAYFSEAYDADESSAGHRMLGRPLPQPPMEGLAPPAACEYPPLSATSSLSSAASADDAYTSEASRGVPAVALLVGVGAGAAAGAMATRTSSKRTARTASTVNRKETAPWEAWDPKSDTDSSAYHFPIPGPKIGTTVYDPAGNRLEPAYHARTYSEGSQPGHHARTYSDPFADGDDDAPLLLPPKGNLAFPLPPLTKPQPISVKTVPSARDTSHEADITSARHLGPRPMPTSRLSSPPPPLPPKSPSLFQLGSELEVHRASVAAGSMRSAVSHSSVFGALVNRDLDLSFDFTPPTVVAGSPRVSPPASPSPSPRHSLPPTPSPPLEMPDMSSPTLEGEESEEDEPLLGTAGPLAALTGLGLYGASRKVSGGSDKELPPRPVSPPRSELPALPLRPPSPDLPPYPPSPALPPCPPSPMTHADSPPAVTAPLRVRSRSRPTSAGGELITPASTRSSSGATNEAATRAALDLSTLDGPPSLATLDRVLESLSPSVTGASRASSSSSIEKFKRAFPALSPATTGASTGSSSMSAIVSTASSPLPLPPPSTPPRSLLSSVGLSTSSAVSPGFMDRPKPPTTPSRAMTAPARPSPAHTAPSTPVRQAVRQGSVASFGSKASLRPGQEGYVSTMVSSINSLDTPESIRMARQAESDGGSVFSRYQ